MYEIFYQERPGKPAIKMAIVREVSLLRKFEKLTLDACGGRVYSRHVLDSPSLRGGHSCSSACVQACAILVSEFGAASPPRPPLASTSKGPA
jgi:hypothetical protein